MAAGYAIMLSAYVHDVLFMMHAHHSDIFLNMFGWSALQVSMGIVLVSRARKIVFRNLEIEEHLETARLIQRKLLPAGPPVVRGFRMHALYLPMDKVGGDFYNIAQSGDSLSVFIADVSGHGLASSYLSLIAKMALENAGPGIPANQVLGNINGAIFRSTVKNNYVTAFFAEIDVKSRIMRYSGAGHLPPLVYRAGTGGFIELRTRGKPLGWFSSLALEEKSLQLEQGDRLVVYTDGITECMNRKREMFGEERFLGFIKSRRSLEPQEFTGALMDTLEQYCGSKNFEDDITLIVLDVL